MYINFVILRKISSKNIRKASNQLFAMLIENLPGYGTLNQGLSLRTFARASVLVPYKMLFGSSGRAPKTVRIPLIAQLINIDISI